MKGTNLIHFNKSWDENEKKMNIGTKFNKNNKYRD